MKKKDVGLTWFNTVFYPQCKTGRAMRYEEGVLPRLAGERVTLFTPWGPRYSWRTRGIRIAETDKEMRVMTFLVSLLDTFKEHMPEKQFSWTFLGADLYGTRINKLPEDVVLAYFVEVQEMLKKAIPEATFELWSSFDAEAERYREQVWRDLKRYVDSGLLTRAENTARALGTGGDPRAYLVERFAEAMLIEDAFRPVKISCVGRHKDAKVDHELPVLYFLPEELHAPWL